MIGLILQGQMANHLFGYCFLRTVAKHHGYDYAIVSLDDEKTDKLNRHRWYAESIFDANVPVIEPRTFSHTHWDINGNYLHPDIQPIDISSIQDDTLIRGLYQGSDVIEKIDVNWLPVKSPKETLPDLNVDDVCFIHFRGTDTIFPIYRPNPPLPKDIKLYYLDAKQRMMDVVGKSLTFVTITDDIPLAKQCVESEMYLNHSAYLDFYLMYKAKYLIIPNSTFSWFAGFLGRDNQVCIAPTGWFFYQHNPKIHTKWCYTSKFIWV